MRTLVNKTELIRGINQVSRVAGNSATMDILKGILVTIKGDSVELFATNLDISVKASLPADVYEDGKFVIAEGKLFSDLVKKLPNEEIALVVEEGRLILESGKSKAELVIRNAEDYPAAPSVVGENSIELGGEELKELISKTAFATAQEETRPILTGILFEVANSRLNLVSLDGLKLAHAYKDIKGSSENFSAVIPGKGCLEIARTIDAEALVTLVFGSNHVMLSSEGVELTVRLLEGEFIKYSSIIPTDFTMEIVVDKRDILDCVDRASLLAKEGNTSLIRLLIDNEKIIIESNSQLGKAHEELSIIAHEGNDKLEIAFNSKLFTEGMKVINSEKVKLKFNGAVSPVIVVPMDEKENYKYLGLPVRFIGSK
jgi:DNA polymerase-3 subunit beta